MKLSDSVSFIHHHHQCIKEHVQQQLRCVTSADCDNEVVKLAAVVYIIEPWRLFILRLSSSSSSYQHHLIPQSLPLCIDFYTLLYTLLDTLFYTLTLHISSHLFYTLALHTPLHTLFVRSLFALHTHTSYIYIYIYIYSLPESVFPRTLRNFRLVINRFNAGQMCVKIGRLLVTSSSGRKPLDPLRKFRLISKWCS